VSEVIELENVCVVRGGETIIDSVTFHVNANERWVIIGANGAGKTTLLKLCAGQIQPSSGLATLLGQRLGRVNVFELRT